MCVLCVFCVVCVCCVYVSAAVSEQHTAIYALAVRVGLCVVPLIRLGGVCVARNRWLWLSLFLLLSDDRTGGCSSYLNTLLCIHVY